MKPKNKVWWKREIIWWGEKRKQEKGGRGKKLLCIKKLLNVHSRRPSMLPSVQTINETQILKFFNKGNGEM